MKYVVRDGSGDLLMVAPMRTIQRAFNLSDSAISRIQQEAGVAEGCTLHFNSRRHAVSGDASFVIVFQGEV